MREKNLEPARHPGSSDFKNSCSLKKLKLVEEVQVLPGLLKFLFLFLFLRVLLIYDSLRLNPIVVKCSSWDKSYC